MVNFNIKRISNKAIDDLYEIFAEYQVFYDQKPNKNKNSQFLKDIIKNNDAIFHIAYRNQEPIGFTGIYFSYSSVSAEKIAIINDLFISPNHRKQGIGKELMKYTINHLKDSKIRHIRWSTKQNNTEAQKLYQDFSSNESKWTHYDIKN